MPVFYIAQTLSMCILRSLWMGMSAEGSPTAFDLSKYFCVNYENGDMYTNLEQFLQF